MINQKEHKRCKQANGVDGDVLFFFPLHNQVMASINQPSSAPVTPAPTRGLSNASLNIGTQSLRGKPRREDWDLFYDQPRQLGTSAGGSGHAGGTGHAGTASLSVYVFRFYFLGFG